MHNAVVFVHLGNNPSQTLLSMADAARSGTNKTRIYLITDFPDKWQDFPGDIIKYQDSQRNNFISKFLKKYPEFKSIAGGYWLYSLERLFALKSIYNVLTSDSNFVHLESDVLCMLNDQDFELMAQRVNKVACPRFSEDRGVASIFFVPNEKELDKILEYFIQILSGPDSPTNDMDLLGICLNNHMIHELPSAPSDAWVNQRGEKLVFDGAAYGQYLFGQDPFHTNGHRISGFQNPYFAVNLKSTKWWIEKPQSDTTSSLFFSWQNINYRVLNLHIHSKLILTAPGLDSSRWMKAILEANGEIERIPDQYEPNHIHTLKISVLNRIRIANRKGFCKALCYAIVRRIRLIREKIWGKGNG